MLNTDCLNCGVRNFLGDEICVGCGASLTLQTHSFIRDESPEWQPQIDPDTPYPGVAPFGFSDALSQTFSLFFGNLWLITKIVFVIVAPFEIFKAVSLVDANNELQLAAAFFLGATSKVLVAPALIYALMKVLQTGEAPGVHESYRWGLTKLAKVSVCALISWVLQGLGYLFLIIPGIIIGLAMAVVYPVAVLERTSIAQTLRRSSELTRGHRLEIFAMEIVLAVLLMIITVPAGLFAAADTFWGLRVVASIVGDVLEHTGTILALVMYLSLPRDSNRGHTIYAFSK